MNPKKFNPITNLPIQAQLATVVIEPNAYLTGFSAESYDSATLTALLTVQNTVEQDVDIVLPFSTDEFSAQAAVTSAGSMVYKQRKTFKRITQKDTPDLVAYLSKMGVDQSKLTSQDLLRQFVKGYKVVNLHLPATNCVIRIRASIKINPTETSVDHRDFALRLYAPLPSFVMAGGQTNLTLTVEYKAKHLVPGRTINEAVVSEYPGQGVPSVVFEQKDAMVFGDSDLMGWHWRNDPVIDLSYRYN